MGISFFFFNRLWFSGAKLKKKKKVAVKVKTGQEGFLGGKLAVSNGREDEVAFDEKRGGTKFG